MTFALIFSVIQQIKSLSIKLIVFTDPVSLIILAVCTLSYIWWFIISLQLRGMNKQIDRLKKDSKAHLKSIYPLREATDIESLDKAFAEISHKWPKYSSATLEEFDQRKNQLASSIEAQ